jgi:TrmH family RNA methyltransferase
MKTISSRDNAFYKELKALATSSQARRKAGRSLLDGVHLCQTWLDLRGAPVHCVVSEGALGNAEVTAVVARCDALGAPVTALPDALFNAVSHLLFVIATPQPAGALGLTQAAVLLDGVQDPGNVGSILRSAAASGVKQVYCSPGTAFCWSPKVLRAAMGAHFVLDIFEHVELAPLVREATVPVLATSGYAPMPPPRASCTRSICARRWQGCWGMKGRAYRANCWRWRATGWPCRTKARSSRSMSPRARRCAFLRRCASGICKTARVKGWTRAPPLR